MYIGITAVFQDLIQLSRLFSKLDLLFFSSILSIYNIALQKLTYKVDFCYTGNDLMFQIMEDFAGNHFAFPLVHLNFGESASEGTEISISTLLAVERFLNWDLA